MMSLSQKHQDLSAVDKKPVGGSTLENHCDTQKTGQNSDGNETVKEIENKNMISDSLETGLKTNSKSQHNAD